MSTPVVRQVFRPCAARSEANSALRRIPCTHQLPSTTCPEVRTHRDAHALQHAVILDDARMIDRHSRIVDLGMNHGVWIGLAASSGSCMPIPREEHLLPHHDRRRRCWRLARPPHIFGERDDATISGFPFRLVLPAEKVFPYCWQPMLLRALAASLYLNAAD